MAHHPKSLELVSGAPLLLVGHVAGRCQRYLPSAFVRSNSSASWSCVIIIICVYLRAYTTKGVACAPLFIVSIGRSKVQLFDQLGVLLEDRFALQLERRSECTSLDGEWLGEQGDALDLLKARQMSLQRLYMA